MGVNSQEGLYPEPCIRGSADTAPGADQEMDFVPESPWLFPCPKEEVT